ncbi:sestrin-like protein [Heterostelium album PN500]|uniref:Sestrin-like protein n=1 Tax=Heterostelium pallidum (strain ATCC 26659 / Pp 5 / PN500) TaxID=670386 RepID=D3AZZ0_HETP5|nr:sestrin-like protein [Heterostelium album PN500]EFA84614.1 sestrin-like protein [Heterostelium album PN500]|eukprot:XP_020436727.1 sestrin-like protein [Heterostelium album PN500]
MSCLFSLSTTTTMLTATHTHNSSVQTYILCEKVCMISAQHKNILFGPKLLDISFDQSSHPELVIGKIAAALLDDRQDWLLIPTNTTSTHSLYQQQSGEEDLLFSNLLQQQLQDEDYNQQQQQQEGGIIIGAAGFVDIIIEYPTIVHNNCGRRRLYASSPSYFYNPPPPSSSSSSNTNPISKPYFSHFKRSDPYMEHQNHYSPPQSPLSVSDPMTGYFQNLQSPDINIRKSAIENIITTLSNPDNEKLLRSYINNIVVLATESPFDEITESFSNLLKSIQDKYHIPKQKTTSFINETQLPPLNTNDELTKRLFQEVFLQSGRVNHIVRLLGWHPQYLERFLSSYNKVMRDPGPLPLPWRNYIGQDAWSIAELVQAMILICTFLSLSGFVFSCGILPEYGLSQEERPQFSLNDSDCEVEDSSASENTIKVMELLMKKRSQEEDEEDQDIDRQQEFHNAGMESGPPFETASSSSGGGGDSDTGMIDLERYIGNYTMSHTDFDVSSREYTIFSIQDYSWKEHGYELVSRIFPDAAPLLDEEFNFVYTMTYYRFNNSTDIDTLPFRRAVWYYVQRVKGMCHDDYNYQEVNMFLNRNLKYYVKKAVCFPDNITKVDYSKLGFDLKPDEKCHLALLAVCSHKQAALLYGLYTVMCYQNRR